MARSDRHIKIIELISKNDINTQEELVSRLKSSGYNVTQATVSRDIKELGLLKVMTDDRKYKYCYVKAETNSGGSAVNLFRETVLSIEHAQNLIVLKCIAAGAGASAAIIDKMNMPEIIGTIAGDDTVLIIVNNIASVKGVLNRLKQMST
ncbi:MAG: arginine repressor [Christensenellales bacterium]|jgi:transcriptional regulator of arginine metabolism